MANLRKIGMALVWPILATSFILLFILPAFLHSVDFGSQKINVEQLNDKTNFESKNIIVSGFPLIDSYLSIETTNLRSRVSSYTYYIPVVPAGWKNGEEITCLLQLTGKELDELTVEEKKLTAQNSDKPHTFNAVVRNTMWEGVDDDVVDEFKKSFKISENLVLIEYGTQSSYPLWIGGFVFLIALLGSYKILSDGTYFIANKVVFSLTDLKKHCIYEANETLFVLDGKQKKEFPLNEIQKIRITENMFISTELHLRGNAKIVIDSKSQENKNFVNGLLVKLNKPQIDWSLPFPQTRIQDNTSIKGYEIIIR